MRTTTIQKYNNLCDMNIIDRAKYDINSKVQLIIQEVQDLMDKYEQEARAIYWPETAKKENK